MLTAQDFDEEAREKCEEIARSECTDFKNTGCKIQGRSVIGENEKAVLLDNGITYVEQIKKTSSYYKKLIKIGVLK